MPYNTLMTDSDLERLSFAAQRFYSMPIITNPYIPRDMVLLFNNMVAVNAVPWLRTPAADPESTCARPLRAIALDGKLGP